MQAQKIGVLNVQQKTVACDCGAEYLTGIVVLGERTVRQHPICPKCMSTRQSPIPAATRQYDREAAWRMACPIGYQDTIASRLPGGMVSASRVEGWRPGKDGRGLLICGDTGRGKTRLMWLGARQWMADGVVCEVVDDPLLNVGYSDALGSGHGMDYIGDLLRPKVLLWDDFGKGAATPRYREIAYIVIEKRMAARRPMVVTTQLNGDDSCDLFGDRDGSALVRRLRECCEVISV